MPFTFGEKSCSLQHVDLLVILHSESATEMTYSERIHHQTSQASATSTTSKKFIHEPLSQIKMDVTGPEMILVTFLRLSEEPFKRIMAVMVEIFTKQFH